MMIDLTGHQFGNYLLIRRLGYGGFASVYMGQHVRIASQRAAIKILHLVNVDTEKFHQEAETTASLIHPNIVRLFDFDIQQGTPFLVLDFAPHGSLLARYPKENQLPLDIVVQYVKEIASALQYAHDRNVIHRDIKPENILIGHHNQLLLSDFGIAVLSKTGRTSLQQDYKAGGTPYYMAPEMFRGKPQKASDQYALAVVVYEWLCCSLPFTEGDFIQLGYQHTHEPVPSLREKNPTISPRVEAVVMKALMKKPEERFSSVQQFAQALEEASEASPIGTPLLVYRGHGDGYIIGAWSPNGKFFATGGVSGIVQVWDAMTNKLLWTCRDYTGKVRALAWSSDSLRIASVAHYAIVLIWEASSGRLLQTYRGHSGPIYALGWSPDGLRIASGSGDTTVQVWEANSGRLLCTYSGHSSRVTTLAWSPDGSRIASGAEDRTVQIWEANSGQPLRTYNGHTNSVTTLAWSPDGSRIASGAEDRTVQIWEANSGRLLNTYDGHSGRVTTLAWSPDGSRIASGAEYTVVQVWEANSGRLLNTYDGHSSCVTTLAWSPDGSRIASGARDSTVQVWEANSGRLLCTYSGHTDWVYMLAWSPDGSRIASGSWDTTPTRLHVWEANRGRLLRTYNGQAGPTSDYEYTYNGSVIWSLDGLRIASGSWDKMVLIWEVNSGQLLQTYSEHSGKIYAIAWSPDGSHIASGAEDTTVQVWEVA